MHILLIGATGRTGQLILSDLLSRSHTATVLVRDPSAISAAAQQPNPNPNPNLTIVPGTPGTPLSPSDISSAFTSSPKPIDAVIVALGAPIATPFSKPTAPPRLMAEAHRNLVSAMRDSGYTKRIVTISAFGVGNSRGNVSCVLNLMLRHTNMAAQFEDHDCVDEEMSVLMEGKGDGIEWTGVRPVMLAEGDAEPVRDFGDEGAGVRLMEKISRRSLARFIIEDCVEQGEWVGRTPVIAN